MTDDDQMDLKAVCADISRRQRYRRGAKKMGTVISELLTRRLDLANEVLCGHDR